MNIKFHIFRMKLVVGIYYVYSKDICNQPV